MEMTVSSEEVVVSPLHQARLNHPVTLPTGLGNPINTEVFEGETPELVGDKDIIKEHFPNLFGKPLVTIGEGNPAACDALRVGVILSGGQAPGGHNVIAGLLDSLREMNGNTVVYGFEGGAQGLLDEKRKELTTVLVNEYRNQGGFDIIGSGRKKIHSTEEFAKVERVCRESSLDALVIIGGDDSNTNAALLAEYFLKEDNKCCVIGVPKTIDGDLKNKHIECSFGFDTASKIYSGMIGNVARDCLSAKKYYHFIRLMGRSASHITLECALQTQPNIAIIGEEVAANNQTLIALADELCDKICKRANDGKNYGVILVPEGLIEFIPEMRELIFEMNELLGSQSTFNNLIANLSTPVEKICRVNEQLSPRTAATFNTLPQDIQEQLVLDRDSHGNVQVSRVETEKLLIKMVERELRARKDRGVFRGKFASVSHFFGYEGRSAFPSNFDCNYSYALGKTAAALVGGRYTGYMAAVQNLRAPAAEWKAAGVPLYSLMNVEKRHGVAVPVIKKALVDLKDMPFRTYKNERGSWAIADLYRYPGPPQYFGDPTITDATTKTLELEQG